jgi:hypothetical protein
MDLAGKVTQALEEEEEEKKGEVASGRVAGW